jgi:hypothetical protein
MAAQTNTFRTVTFAARLAATVPALVLASATVQASATLIAAKCATVTAAAAALDTGTMFDAVTGLLPSVGRGLELCVFAELVQALGFQQFSSSIWQVLQVVGSVAGQSFLSHAIWSAINLLVGS